MRACAALALIALLCLPASARVWGTMDTGTGRGSSDSIFVHVGDVLRKDTIGAFNQQQIPSEPPERVITKSTYISSPWSDSHRPFTLIGCIVGLGLVIAWLVHRSNEKFEGQLLAKEDWTESADEGWDKKPTTDTSPDPANLSMPRSPKCLYCGSTLDHGQTQCTYCGAPK